MNRTSHNLSLRNLTKIYSYSYSEQALRGLSLDIAAGEFVSLLGPSGSGKSTTLMIIAGFEEPSSGDVVVDDRSIIGIPAHRRDIGVVFQNYALFPKMTIAQNIGFPLRMRKRGRDEIEKTVRRLLELVRLSGLEDRYPKQLSGGQQQRVALARALAFDPRLLLLDEPMGALDRSLREQLQLEVKRIQRTLNVTTIYVTHDQEEALLLSDRVAIMNAGRMEQVGAPAEVYNRPANRFVAEFLGVANFLQATVTTTAHSGGGYALFQGIPLAFSGGQCLAPGRPVELFIRPECISLGRQGESPFTGILEAAVFTGETIQFCVRLGDTRVQVVATNRTECPVYQPGDSVSLRWDPRSVIAL